MPVLLSFNDVQEDPGLRIFIERISLRLLRAKGLMDHEISVSLVSDSIIRQINNNWFERPWPTNCISFPQTSDGVGPHRLLGDIVISLDSARREALDSGRELRGRLLELLIHGFCHLLGYDHERGEQAFREQDACEKKLLDFISKERIMADLCVNVDHVATIREARGGDEPDPVVAAGIVELAGANGVVVHLREDRRHIQDRDLRLIRQIVRTRLVLEMAATEEMLAIATEVRPDVVTLVPERREEITTEGGLDVVANEQMVRGAINRLKRAGIPVTLFVDPEEHQIEASSKVDAQNIEIHTGRYAEATGPEQVDREFDALVKACRLGADLGLGVHVGHGLNYGNVVRLTSIPEIEEYSIGHSIISKAVMVGLERAVRDMIALIKLGHVV